MQNKINKACFQHDIAYGGFQDLPRKTASEKVLRDKAFDITKNPKFDGYQRGLASIVYKLLIKNSATTRADNSDTHTGIGINSDSVSQNEQLEAQLPDELRKPIIRNFEINVR